MKYIRMRVTFISACLCIIMLQRSAYAGVQGSFNVGGYGVVLPDGTWGGLYVTFGPSWTVPLNKRLTLIPAVSCEFEPQHGNWGCGGAITFDVLLAERVAFDLVLLVTSDTDAHSRTTAYVAAGPVLTFILPTLDGKAVWALSIGIQPTVGMRGEGWSLAVPALNLSFGIP